MSEKLLPKVFVGSSSEAKGIAEGFCKALYEDATMIPWWLANDFKPMHSTLDGLWEATARYDFGLFILTPDDRIESRGEEGYSARDNVLFELGLFLGRLGPERAFAVKQTDTDPQKQVKVLSDLAGYTIPRFARGDEYQLLASINNAISPIRKLITEQGRRKIQFKLTSSWDYDSEKENFSMTLSVAKILQHKAELKDKKLVVIARKLDDDINLEDDIYFARSNPRNIPTLILDRDLIINAHCGILNDVHDGDIIEGHVLLVPENVDKDAIINARTISELIDMGCNILESVGKRVDLKKSNGGPD